MVPLREGRCGGSKGLSTVKRCHGFSWDLSLNHQLFADRNSGGTAADKLRRVVELVDSGDWVAKLSEFGMDRFHSGEATTMVSAWSARRLLAGRRL